MKALSALSPRLLPLLPAAAGLLAMAPALFNGFVDWDDMQYVVQNPALRGGWLEALKFYSGFYHPLTTLSYKLDLALFGLSPAGFHAVNLLLYAAVCGLVCRLFTALGASSLSAALGALLFAVHPLHAEAAAWVSGRKELLWGLFALLSLLSYLRYLDEGGGKKLARSFAWFLAALLAKPSAAVLPLLLLLLDLYRGRGTGRAVLLEKLAFVLPAAALALLSWSLSGSVLAAASPEMPAEAGRAAFSAAEAAAAALHALLFYFGKFLAPLELSPLYPALALPVHGYWYLAGAAALLCALSWRVCRRGPGLFRDRAVLGAFFFPACLLPGLAITPPADRYAFLASAGLCLAYGELAGKLAAARPAAGRLLKFLLPAHLLALAALCAANTFTWRNSLALWNRVLAVNPREAVARYGRGNALRAAGLIEEAEAEYGKALQLQPRYWRPLANRGRLKAERGDFAGALADYGAAIALYPSSAQLYLNRGNAYAGLRRHHEAASDFRKALELSPGLPAAENGLREAERAVR